MASTNRASRQAALALLAGAACGAVAGVLVASTAPPRDSGLVFLPLIAAPIGVIIAGHIIGRAVLAWVVLLPLMAIGWFFSFALTSGTVPPGLYIALTMALAIAVYPFNRPSTRLLSAAALAAGILSIAAAGFWLTDTSGGRTTAMIIAALAVLALLAAGVASFRSNPDAGADEPPRAPSPRQRQRQQVHRIDPSQEGS